MKRIVSILIIIAMCAGIMTGCSAKRNKNKDAAKSDATPPVETVSPTPAVPEVSSTPSPVPTPDLPTVTDPPAAEDWKVSSTYAVPDKIKALFDKAMDGYLGALYKPFAYLGSRIDSGKEYALLCGALEAAPDSKPYYALVYIHEDFDGKVKISDIKDMSPNGELADKWKNIQALYGSWRVAENAAEGVEIFEAATANITDTIFSVISVMGEQIIAGKNYCVLCQCRTRGNEMPFYAFVYVNKNLENNYKVSRIVDLDASGQPVSSQF